MTGEFCESFLNRIKSRTDYLSVVSENMLDKYDEIIFDSTLKIFIIIYIIYFNNYT